MLTLLSESPPHAVQAAGWAGPHRARVLHRRRPRPARRPRRGALRALLAASRSCRAAPNTPASLDELAARVAAAAARGYAVADEEFEPASPPSPRRCGRFDGRIVAALNVSGPAVPLRAAARPRPADRWPPGPCAEGYLFEFERRGYLQAGAFVPEVVLEHPDLVVAQLHREFVHAGSDVVEAFTYYAHREKLRLIGKEDVLEPINRQALRSPGRSRRDRRAPRRDICNTNVFDRRRRRVARRPCAAMFEEQVGWAVDAGVDFVIGETFSWARGGADRARRHQARRPAGRDHARDPPRARNARGLDARGGLPAPRGRRRGRRRAQLHPRPRTMLPLLARIRAAVRWATSPRCRCPTARPTPSRASSR